MGAPAAAVPQASPPIEEASASAESAPRKDVSSPQVGEGRANPAREATAREQSLPKSGAAAAKAPAKAIRSFQDSSTVGDDRDTAQPAFAEPPELRRALAEFETQLTALSTTEILWRRV
ncbi:MAG: hypothetical protein QM784_36545 [Polyangiaceae bacterium]